MIVRDCPDPRGRNPKHRPCVVIAVPGEIETDGAFFVVAITTTLPDPLPDDHVELPWSRPRHPRTGLNEKNAAVCHWLVKIEASHILRRIGRVPNRQFDRIARLLDDAE